MTSQIPALCAKAGSRSPAWRGVARPGEAGRGKARQGKVWERPPDRRGPFLFGKWKADLMLALAATLLTGTPAAAALITRTGNDIFLSGVIERGDDKAFAEIANGDTAVVHLDSIGGNLLASLRIGEIIRSKRYGTVVPANGQCASGCAFIWVSGVRRELGKGAWLLVHCARRPNESTCDPSSEAPILSYLLGMGAPQKMLEAEKRAYSAGPVAQFLCLPIPKVSSQRRASQRTMRWRAMTPCPCQGRGRFYAPPRRSSNAKHAP